MTQHSTSVTDCISMVCACHCFTRTTSSYASHDVRFAKNKLVILNETDKKIQNETDLHSQSIIQDWYLSHTQLYSEYITSSEM